MVSRRQSHHRLIRAALWAGLAALSGPAAAQQLSFPAAGHDVVYHLLRVDVDVANDSTVDETLVFNGRMEIQRSNPHTNPSGFRQIDFLVEDWRAVAYSTTFSDSITYALAKDVVQPTSTIIAEQLGNDFPAQFTFEVLFNAFLGQTLVFPRHHGRPKGDHFLSVPPDGDPLNSPTITQFETAQIIIQHPTLGPIRFAPRDCNDQRSTTVATSTQGTPSSRFRVVTRPSPTRGPLDITIDLPERGPIVVAIYDVAGRLVRELALGDRRPGRIVVHWDGRGSGGAGVAAGLYVLRVRGQGRDLGATRFLVVR